MKSTGTAITRRLGAALARTALVSLAVAAAACSDAGPTSPAAPRLQDGAPAFGKGNAPSSGSDTVTNTFVYSGKALKQAFGDGHEIDFTPTSVCDPTTSGYGPGMWDKPCTAAKQPITFTVKSWRDASGRPQMTFSPDVRFTPSGNVTMYLNDNPGHGKKADVLWCSPLVNGCIDESLSDPQMKSWVSSGRVARRLKHFSGYTVIFGLDGSSDGM